MMRIRNVKLSMKTITAEEGGHITWSVLGGVNKLKKKYSKSPIALKVIAAKYDATYRDGQSIQDYLEDLSERDKNGLLRIYMMAIKKTFNIGGYMLVRLTRENTVFDKDEVAEDNLVYGYIEDENKFVVLQTSKQKGATIAVFKLKSD